MMQPTTLTDTDTDEFPVVELPLPDVEYQTIFFPEDDAEELDRTLEAMDAEGWGIIWQDALVTPTGTMFFVRLRRANKPGIKTIHWGD